MNSDPLYGAVPPDDSGYTIQNTHNPNTISCRAGGDEMLRVGPDGFWVRGKKVPQDDKEAQIVYNAMKEFLTWSQLTRR